ncbi:MAG: MaoC/PaaZ C-terminal domain-containing protein [Bacteroidota bacterium]
MTGLYYEEFEIGQKIVTVGRTITESDIMTFAGLSGDFTQLHTDAEYSSKTPFGQRIAHGLLGVAVTSGLAMRTGVLEGTVIAFREIGEWKFTKPVFIGDTIHARLTVTDTKPYPRLNGGSVSIDFDVRNQRNETVMRGTWVVIVASKP